LGKVSLAVLATNRPVVSGLGGDSEGNYGDGLTKYGGEDGDGAMD